MGQRRSVPAGVPTRRVVHRSLVVQRRRCLFLPGPDPSRRYPQALGLVEEAARAGERGETVRTLLGRGSPATGRAPADDPDMPESDREGLVRDRRAHGRFTRNFVVQGTGAEWALCWIADLRNRLWTLASGPLIQRPHLVFFLHDEVVVHAPAHLADAVVAQVTEAARTAGRLLFGDQAIDFRLTTAVVSSYADAGKAGTGQQTPPASREQPGAPHR